MLVAFTIPDSPLPIPESRRSKHPHHIRHSPALHIAVALQVGTGIQQQLLNPIGEADELAARL